MVGGHTEGWIMVLGDLGWGVPLSTLGRAVLISVR